MEKLKGRILIGGVGVATFIGSTLFPSYAKADDSKPLEQDDSDNNQQLPTSTSEEEVRNEPPINTESVNIGFEELTSQTETIDISMPVAMQDGVYVPRDVAATSRSERAGMINAGIAEPKEDSIVYNDDIQNPIADTKAIIESTNNLSTIDSIATEVLDIPDRISRTVSSVVNGDNVSNPAPEDVIQTSTQFDVGRQLTAARSTTNTETHSIPTGTIGLLSGDQIVPIKLSPGVSLKSDADGTYVFTADTSVIEVAKTPEVLDSQSETIPLPGPPSEISNVNINSSQSLPELNATGATGNSTYMEKLNSLNFGPEPSSVVAMRNSVSISESGGLEKRSSEWSTKIKWLEEVTSKVITEDLYQAFKKDGIDKSIADLNIFAPELPGSKLDGIPCIVLHWTAGISSDPQQLAISMLNRDITSNVQSFLLQDGTLHLVTPTVDTKAYHAAGANECFGIENVANDALDLTPEQAISSAFMARYLHEEYGMDVHRDVAASLLKRNKYGDLVMPNEDAAGSIKSHNEISESSRTGKVDVTTEFTNLVYNLTVKSIEGSRVTTSNNNQLPENTNLLQSSNEIVARSSPQALSSGDNSTPSYSARNIVDENGFVDPSGIVIIRDPSLLEIVRNTKEDSINSFSPGNFGIIPNINRDASSQHVENNGMQNTENSISAENETTISTTSSLSSEARNELDRSYQDMVTRRGKQYADEQFNNLSEGSRKILQSLEPYEVRDAHAAISLRDQYPSSSSYQPQLAAFSPTLDAKGIVGRAMVAYEMVFNQAPDKARVETLSAYVCRSGTVLDPKNTVEAASGYSGRESGFNPAASGDNKTETAHSISPGLLQILNLNPVIDTNTYDGVRDVDANYDPLQAFIHAFEMVKARCDSGDSPFADWESGTWKSNPAAIQHDIDRFSEFLGIIRSSGAYDSLMANYSTGRLVNA
jgi:hypothetical protein